MPCKLKDMSEMVGDAVADLFAEFEHAFVRDLVAGECSLFLSVDDASFAENA